MVELFMIVPLKSSLRAVIVAAGMSKLRFVPHSPIVLGLVQYIWKELMHVYGLPLRERETQTE